jgi:hypothetical protein
MLIFDPKSLGNKLSAGGLRRNPARKNEDLEKVYASISGWAKKSMDWLTENEKMSKPVPGQKWMLRGVSLIPSDRLFRFFTYREGGKLHYNRKLMKDYNVTESDLHSLTNVCPHATKGCMAVCLVDAGQMGLPASRNAQVRRHLTFAKERKAFMTILMVSIAGLVQTARKERARVGIRLNVTSDIPWQDYEVEVPPWLSKKLGVRSGKYKNIMSVFPKVLFYDYTKVPHTMQSFMAGKDGTGYFPKNYHLAWSLAETTANRKTAVKVLAGKYSTVTVPFDILGKQQLKGKVKLSLQQKLEARPLPETLGFRFPGGSTYVFDVIDADRHDLRPIDPPGTVAGLRFKLPRSKAALGKTDVEKMRMAGAFVVSTRGSKHPVIPVVTGY